MAKFSKTYKKQSPENTAPDTTAPDTTAQDATSPQQQAPENSAQRTEKPKNSREAMRTLWGRIVVPYKWWFAAILTLVGLQAGTQMSTPKLLGHATDTIFTGVVSKKLPAGVSKAQIIAGLRAKGDDTFADIVSRMPITPGAGIDFHKLGMQLLLVTGIFLAGAVFFYIASLVIRTVVQRVGYQLRQDIHEKIDRLPLSYVDQHARGDLLSRVTNDVDNLTQSLQQTLAQFISSIFILIGVLILMISIDWKLALLSLIVVPVGGFISGAIMRRAQPYFTEQWKSTGDLANVVDQAFTGHEVVTAYGLQRVYSDQMNEANRRLTTSSFRSQFLAGLLPPVMIAVGNLNYVVLAVAGGLQMAAGNISVGSVQALIQYSRQFTQPLSQLAQMAFLVQSLLASAERVFEFLDAPEMKDTRTSAPATADDAASDTATAAPASVEFRNVTFSYQPGHPTIRNLSLTVNPGETVAIVGPTGAGKTTLVNLLMRFYEIDSGSITIGGRDIREMPKDELRRHFGMVLQDTWLMHGTIYDNIAFGTTGASRADVRAAARATSVDRLICQLPDGYDTVLGAVSDDDNAASEKAEVAAPGSKVVTDELREHTELSVGEQQLITIARAFISDPAILILDEATSSVDTRTEMHVQEALWRLREGRTSFIIAHRLSTIRKADTIIVMENGDVVEQGSHQQLLEKKGAYAKLYHAQFPAPGAGVQQPVNE